MYALLLDSKKAVLAMNAVAKVNVPYDIIKLKVYAAFDNDIILNVSKSEDCLADTNSFTV